MCGKTLKAGGVACVHNIKNPIQLARQVMDKVKMNIFTTPVVLKYKSMVLLLFIYQNSATVLPAKSDSDVVFGLQSYQGLIIDRSRVYKAYPQDRINIQMIYQFAWAQLECTS